VCVHDSTATPQPSTHCSSQVRKIMAVRPFSWDPSGRRLHVCRKHQAIHTKTHGPWQSPCLKHSRIRAAQSGSQTRRSNHNRIVLKQMQATHGAPANTTYSSICLGGNRAVKASGQVHNNKQTKCSTVSGLVVQWQYTTVWGLGGTKRSWAREAPRAIHNTPRTRRSRCYTVQLQQQSSSAQTPTPHRCKSQLVQQSCSTSQHCMTVDSLVL
jgi:hypothetical protein